MLVAVIFVTSLSPEKEHPQTLAPALLGLIATIGMYIVPPSPRGLEALKLISILPAVADGSIIHKEYS
jgi:hypothetical protein